MKQLAEDLYLIEGFPPHTINIYWMDGYVIDSGTRHSFRRIVRQVADRPVIGHVLTHAHPDHQGSSRRVCEHYGVPLWCGAGDADAMEAPGGVLASLVDNRINRTIGPLMVGPHWPVARRLREGDEVGRCRVLEVPGHSPGHIALWREADRVLILGDVLASMNPFSLRHGLREPPRVFTPDPAENRRSARRLAGLEPRLVCFGHGPPLDDTGAFVRFIEGLPD
jgi:glyoxylase-like metal-dependent hydrolase (beta-lactamase superfamily II)